MLQFIDISKSILYDNEKLQNQALEMINACVSHEMRNPLNSIVAHNIEKKFLYAKLEDTLSQLEQEVLSGTRASKLVEKSQFILNKLKVGLKVQESSSFCLQFMIQDMLDFAQIKQGKFRTNLEQFDIIEAVKDVMMIQQRKADDNKIKLFANFVNISDIEQDNLGSFSSLIVTDKQRIMQVLLCLQSNALKFTHEGEVEIIVEIRKISQEKFLQITVRDTGIGISKKNQGKLFKFFGFLKESERMNTSGVGLGLVISR